MATPEETLDPEPSTPPAQAPTPAAEAAAVEQGRLSEASDSFSCPIPSAEPSAPPAAVVPAGAHLEDLKPSASPAAGAQLGDPKPSASPAAGAQLEDPKPSVAVVSLSAAVKRPWLRLRLRPMIKLASWPVRRVLHGMDRACDILVISSRQLVVVRCVAKMSTLVPDRVRGAVFRVLQLFGSPSLNSRGLPISDPSFERLYFELDMERVRVVVLVVVAAGIVLFITLESLLKVVSKISGFYNNVMWHRAEAARMLQKAAEQKLKVPTPAAKQQLPPPATEQQLLPLAAELLIPTPPPPAMDMC